MFYKFLLADATAQLPQENVTFTIEGAYVEINGEAVRLTGGDYSVSLQQAEQAYGFNVNLSVCQQEIDAYINQHLQTNNLQGQLALTMYIPSWELTWYENDTHHKITHADACCIEDKVYFGELYFGNSTFDEYLKEKITQAQNRNHELNGKFFATGSQPSKIGDLRHLDNSLISTQREDGSVHVEGFLFELELQGDIVVNIKDDDMLDIDYKPIGYHSGFGVGDIWVEGEFREITLFRNAGGKIGKGWHIKIENLGYQNQADGEPLDNYIEKDQLPQKLWDGKDEAIQKISKFIQNFVFPVQPFVREELYTLLMDLGSSSSVVAMVCTVMRNGMPEVSPPEIQKINPQTEKNHIVDDEVVVLENPVADNVQPDLNALEYLPQNTDIRVHTNSRQLLEDANKNKDTEQNDAKQLTAVENDECQSPSLFGIEIKDGHFLVQHLHNQSLREHFVKEIPTEQENRYFIQNTKNYLRYPQFQQVYNFVRTNQGTFDIKQLQRGTSAILRGCYASQLGLPFDDGVTQLEGNLKTGAINDNKTCCRVVMAVPNTLRYEYSDVFQNVQASLFYDLLHRNNIIIEKKDDRVKDDRVQFVPEAYAVLFNHIRNHAEPGKTQYVIFDMGAGTTDVTFAELTYEDFNMKLNISAQASSHKAGHYIDYLIARYFYEYLQVKGGNYPKETIEQINPDRLVNYCMGETDQPFFVNRLQKIMIENTKVGKGNDYGDYSGFDTEFHTYYQLFMKYVETGELINNDEIRRVFDRFVTEIVSMTTGYYEMVRKLGREHLGQGQENSVKTKVIVSGRGALWKPIRKHLKGLQALEPENLTVIGCDDDNNAKDRKYQVCQGLAYSLEWTRVSDIAKSRIQDHCYQDKLSHKYHYIYIIALGTRRGNNIEMNRPTYQFYYDVTSANEALKTKVCDELWVYTGICLMDNITNTEDLVKNSTPTPYFSARQLGDFMDNNNVLQMCRASFATQRGEKNPLIVFDERGYVKLRFENAQNPQRPEEAVIFPYVANQRLNGRIVNVQEVLPTSFYQANWPNPIGWQGGL